MSFNNIKGQDKPVGILKNYLAAGNFSGTYLFSGDEGIGKFLTAKTFAKAVNCLEGTHDCCDNCNSCRRIDKEEHPDIHFIEATQSDIIKIEYIRDLKRKISLRPYEAQKRVFIINDAQNLNAEASGALLKVLEEPPQDNLIILVTSKQGLLFETIISRCRIVKFFPLEREKLKQMLLKDCHMENSLAHFLAYFCEGRYGRAIRLSATETLLRKNSIIDAFGRADSRSFEIFFAENKDNLHSCLGILLGWLRDIYISKAGVETCGLINFDRKDELMKLAQRFSFGELERMLGRVSDSAVYLGQNINKRLIFANLRAELWKG